MVSTLHGFHYCGTISVKIHHYSYVGAFKKNFPLKVSHRVYTEQSLSVVQLSNYHDINYH